MQPIKKYKVILVPIITLIVGFLSFLFLSIYYKVFWINSKYDVPLIYNISVMIGDAIILPTVNYKIFNLVLNYLGLEILKTYKRRLIIWLVATFIISLISNVFIHLAWINDQITDFVGFKQGEFSPIGYWHLIYSFFQMEMLFMFPIFWFVAIKEKNTSGIAYCYNIWKFVFLFSSLAIFDTLNKYLFVYHDKTFFYALQIDRFGFTTMIASIILLIIMEYIEKRNL